MASSVATVGGREGTARVWNLITQEPMLPPLHQAIPIEKVRFSRDGRLLITLGRDDRSKAAEVRAWDLTRAGDWAGTEQQFPGRVVWHEPGDRYVVVASGITDRMHVLPTPEPPAAELRVIERQSGQPVGPPLKVKIKIRAVLLAVSLSLDGRRLAAAVGSPQLWQPSDLFAWDVHSGSASQRLWRRRPGCLPGPGADGQHAAALLRVDPRTTVNHGDQRCNADKVWLWDIGKGQGELLPTGKGLGVLLAAFSRDGHRLVTVQPGRASYGTRPGAERSVRVSPNRYRTKQRRTSRRWSGRGWPDCRAPSFDPGGRMLAVSVGASTVHWIDPETGRALRPTLAADEDISLLRFSGNGRRLIVARFGGEKASVWDVSDETSPGRPRSLSPRGAAGQASASRHSDVEEIALNSDGRVALTAAHSDEVRLWDVDSGVPLSPPLPFAGPLSRAWFDDNNHVAMLTRHAYMAFEVRWIWTRDLNFGGLSPDELSALPGCSRAGGSTTCGGPFVSSPRCSLRPGTTCRGHSSALLNEPREPLAVWHRRLAKESEMAGLTFAARVHLDGLIAAVPEDPEPGRLPYMVYGRAPRYSASWENGIGPRRTSLGSWSECNSSPAHAKALPS